MVVVSVVAAALFTVAAVSMVVAVSMAEDCVVAVSTEVDSIVDISVVEALSWRPVGDGAAGDGATDFTEGPW